MAAVATAATEQSTTSHFTHYESKLNKNDITFVCEHIPLHFVNGIRRFSMNSIPIGGFRDDPPSVQGDERSIQIVQNHTLLYNEMLVTRIAMVPIRQNKLPHIMTKWDSDKQERVYYWERDDMIPKIHLEIKNEDQEPGLLDITTEHMKTSDDDKDFFVRDLVTNEPILIHSLMFPYPAIDVPFALNAVPVIGTGRQNSSFTPVGTTGMRFVEDESRVERVMETWMENKAKERASKGLEPLSEAELDLMRKNFSLLEKQRIYKQDSRGPTHIQLRVESLGSLSSPQIVRETMRMMAVQMADLHQSLSETSISQETGTISIDLGKVDHTIAQCLVESWKLLPITADYAIPSYKLTHPLKEQMIMNLRVVDESKPIDTKAIMNALHLCIGITIDDISYLLNEWQTLSQLTETRNHSTIADSPDHWNWMESLPMTSVSHLPNRTPRTKWTIAPTLLRSGS